MQVKRNSATVTQSHSPIGDDGPDESTRGGADCRGEFQSNGPRDHQAIHSFQASLHHIINNAVECDDVRRTDNTTK